MGRTQNVMAASSIANIVKSSLGPVGLDKMMVDDVGDVTITNDGATILQLLEVEHPAAKVLVELAALQDEEVGDGTTSVVIIAAELLKNADELVKQKIHPTSIIAGYRLAMKESVKYIKEHLTFKVDDLGEDCLINAAKTCMSSKLIGADSEFFSKMIVEAAHDIKVSDGKGGHNYPIKAINVLKSHGKSARESMLIKGYALNCTIAAQQMPRSIANAKIACLDFSLQKVKMKMGVQLLVSDPDQLDKMRDRESDITKERINKILATGANVILTTGGIDDLCLKYFVEAGAMAVRGARGRILRGLPRPQAPPLSQASPTSRERRASRQLFLERRRRWLRPGSATTNSSSSRAPKYVLQRLSSCAAQATCTATRWSGVSMMPSALSSESLSPSLWSSAVVVLKPLSPSTLRTLQPLFHPENNLPLLTLPSPCWSFQRPWRSTQRRTPLTWSPS